MMSTRTQKNDGGELRIASWRVWCVFERGNYVEIQTLSTADRIPKGTVEMFET